jgi:hypothetical protein
VWRCWVHGNALVLYRGSGGRRLCQ